MRCDYFNLYFNIQRVQFYIMFRICLCSSVYDIQANLNQYHKWESTTKKKQGTNPTTARAHNVAICKRRARSFPDASKQGSILCVLI